MEQQYVTVPINNDIEIEPHQEGYLFALKVQAGLKIKVTESYLKQLQSNEHIQSNFKLNIKRLNRWYWSVCFDEKGE